MNNIGWLALPAKGSADGILIMWRKDRVNCLNNIPGDVTLSCLFSSLSNRESWYFSDIYCKRNNNECNMLRMELEQIQQTWGNKGIIDGDFSMVLRRSKDRGTIAWIKKLWNFNLFFPILI